MDNRIERINWFLRMAALVAERGTCERAQVGAVIVKDGRIISIGYNGSAPGQPHCTGVGCEVDDHLCTCGDCNPEPFVDRCKHAEGCERTIHAEANAIAFAAKAGAATDGCEMYCTHGPCYPCAKLMLSAGIIAIHFNDPYRDPRGEELLMRAGLNMTKPNDSR